jgi:signal transduction histidine kinase
MQLKELQSLLHDLNNSLAVIGANIKCSLVEDDPERAKKRLEKALSRLSDCKDMIKTHRESDKIKDKKEISLESIVESTEYPNNIEVLASSNSSQIMDELDVKRVVDNIVTNSLQANATELLMFQTDKGWVFSDNGDGFSNAALISLKMGENYTSKVDGQGLGTNFVREFCKKNNMSVQFTNKENNKKGALIIMTFNER